MWPVVGVQAQPSGVVTGIMRHTLGLQLNFERLNALRLRPQAPTCTGFILLTRTVEQYRPQCGTPRSISEPRTIWYPGVWGEQGQS
jgi:hypothetical protein